jgi:hypothetical protein
MDRHWIHLNDDEWNTSILQHFDEPPARNPVSDDHDMIFQVIGRG